MEEQQRFFDQQQRATVEAAMARIIPTDDAPGSREAGTVDFVDRYLSGINYIYAKPDGSGFEQLEGRVAQAWRQRIDALRKTYRRGIEELDRRGRRTFDGAFVDLTEDEQDEVLRAVEQRAPEDERDPGSGWTPSDHEADQPALQQTRTEMELDFFGLLAFHTRQGFYADPIYGGNRDRVGWQVIGFPGPESLAEVHSGRYTTIDYFADPLGYPGTEEHHGA
jgi:gluconate 2-dehydrogenase gamma chain